MYSLQLQQNTKAAQEWFFHVYHFDQKPYPEVLESFDRMAYWNTIYAHYTTIRSRITHVEPPLKRLISLVRSLLNVMDGQEDDSGVREWLRFLEKGVRKDWIYSLILLAEQPDDTLSQRFLKLGRIARCVRRTLGQIQDEHDLLDHFFSALWGDPIDNFYTKKVGRIVAKEWNGQACLSINAGDTFSHWEHAYHWLHYSKPFILSLGSFRSDYIIERVGVDWLDAASKWSCEDITRVVHSLLYHYEKNFYINDQSWSFTWHESRLKLIWLAPLLGREIRWDTIVWTLAEKMQQKQKKHLIKLLKGSLMPFYTYYAHLLKVALGQTTHHMTPPDAGCYAVGADFYRQTCSHIEALRKIGMPMKAIRITLHAAIEPTIATGRWPTDITVESMRLSHCDQSSSLVDMKTNLHSYSMCK